MNFGINLSFTVKRWVEPPVWAQIVREKLGLKLVQFTFDLLDPWSPEPLRRTLTSQIRQAAKDWDIEIEGAFGGLANYCFDGLMHPDPAGRQISLEWWKRALDVAAEIGAKSCGGPMGAMTAQDAADSNRRKVLYNEHLESVVELSRAAKAAGVERLLVECTPVPREVPWSIEQSQQFIADLDGRCPVPVKLLVDVGHALYQPLYGPKANMVDWLKGVGKHIGAFHLQNTDFQSDSHWGWPDDRGLFDIGKFGQEVRAAGLESVPAFLEIIYAFEMADDAVLKSITSSVLHCRRTYCQEKV